MSRIIRDWSVVIETVPTVQWCVDPLGKLQRLVHATESETNNGNSTTVTTSMNLIYNKLKIILGYHLKIKLR